MRGFEEDEFDWRAAEVLTFADKGDAEECFAHNVETGGGHRITLQAKEDGKVVVLKEWNEKKR